MIAFPFDSNIIGYEQNGMPIYDRASNAEHFARLLSAFLSNGVFDSNMCQVLAAGGMNVTVGIGNGLIQGRFARVDVPESLTHEPAEGLPRIDTVVLRLDLSSDVNYIVADIVKGKAASEPSSPTLTRDGTVWELGLADVRIPANSTAVSQTNISDTRLNSQRCGLVFAIRTDIDVDGLFAEFDGLLDGMRDAIQTVYDGVEKVNIIEKPATLLASGWSADEPYRQTVVVDGVLGADQPFVDVDMDSAYTADDMKALSAAWAGALKATAGTNTVTVYMLALPEVDIPIKVKVVR